MKNGEKLAELSRILTEQQQEKRDFLVPTSRLRYDDGELWWKPSTDPKDFKVESTSPNEVAILQLYQKCGIPKDYADKCIQAQKQGLLENNVNAWLETLNSTLLVRTIGDTARAILSDSYHPLDNYDLMAAILPIIAELSEPLGLSVYSATVTDRRFYLRLVSEKQTGTIKKGDVVQNGIAITNSEVGHGAISGFRFIRDCVCDNGLIVEKAFRKTHLGKQLLEEFYSDQSRMLDDAVFWSKLNDTIRYLFDPAGFEEFLASINGITEIELQKPAEVVQVVSKRYGLPKASLNDLTNALISGGDTTAWGMISAVTSLAHTADADTAYELHKLGGTLLSTSPAQWKSIIHEAHLKAA